MKNSNPSKIIFALFFLILSLIVVTALQEVAEFSDSFAVGVGDGEIIFEPPSGKNPFCGDGIIDLGEQCDGSNLNGNSCSSLESGSSGTLACKSNCIYDSSGCSVTQAPSNESTSGGTASSSGGGSGGSSGGGGGRNTGTTHIIQEELSSKGCIENWECEEWKNCIDGSQERTCTDINNCNTVKLKPLTERLCFSKLIQMDNEQPETLLNKILGSIISTNNKSNLIVVSFFIALLAILIIFNFARKKKVN